MTTCFVVGLIIGLVQTLRPRGRRDSRPASELFLNNYILWAIGVDEAVNSVMHSVFGDFAAARIGWRKARSNSNSRSPAWPSP